MMAQPGLAQKAKTGFACSFCNSHLITGMVANSKLQLEECEKCGRYFFDAKEINTLMEYLTHPTLPEAPALTFDAKKMIKTESLCPVCHDQPLWTYDGQEDRFKACVHCEGIMTTVEALQKIVHKSLFGSAMFTFRNGAGEFSQCRHCHEEQERSNHDCQKCGREMIRIECQKCHGEMSEYELHTLTIDRCQIDNTVWLDRGEFEQILTAVPDVRKRYEEGRRNVELDGATLAAVGVSYGMIADMSQRKMLDFLWGPLSVFFYP
jgi:Zn-finger nucleic acid-binding protein